MLEGYISVKQAAQSWGVTERRVQHYCSEDAIPGVMRFGRSWAIPAGAEKPADGRSHTVPEKSHIGGVPVYEAGS